MTQVYENARKINILFYFPTICCSSLSLILEYYFVLVFFKVALIQNQNIASTKQNISLKLRLLLVASK